MSFSKPTLIAAIGARRIPARTLPFFFNPSRARARAMKPPVTEAVRVPPSASRTSQSMVMVRSPSRSSATQERSARPISR